MRYFNGLMEEWIEETAGKYPDNIAYEFLGKKVRYSSFIKDIHLFAKGLTDCGVREDDIIAVIMPNSPQALVCLYAANRIGAVVNMIHPLSSPDELLKYLTFTGAEHVLVLDSFYSNLAAIISKTHVKNIIVTGLNDTLPPLKKAVHALVRRPNIPEIKSNPDSGIKLISYRTLIKKATETVSPLPVLKDRRDCMAVIFYSGGTTDKTKGICLSNYAVNCNAAQMKDSVNVKPEDSILSVMPMFHGYGLVAGAHTLLVSGGKCCIIPRFSPETCIKELYRHKCSIISGSPTMLEKMMQSDSWKGRSLSFLKAVICGADSLPVKLEKRLDKFLKSLDAGICVRQGYGMTECVAASTLNRSDRKKYGSVGTPLEGISIKIVEPGTEKELPAGKTGEIVLSSVTNMMCYYNDPETTGRVMKKHSDGKTWIHSMDLGYMDEDGYLFFRGRLKHMIVTSGYNVLPLELEEQINKCELVKKCCVKGIKDDVRIEKVKAFIILKDGVLKTDDTKDIITAYCRKHIAGYAIPREIEFVDSFPLTKVGKIDYSRLN